VPDRRHPMRSTEANQLDAVHPRSRFCWLPNLTAVPPPSAWTSTATPSVVPTAPAWKCGRCKRQRRQVPEVRQRKFGSWRVSERPQSQISPALCPLPLYCCCLLPRISVVCQICVIAGPFPAWRLIRSNLQREHGFHGFEPIFNNMELSRFK